MGGTKRSLQNVSNSSTNRWILCTGQPGSGKTTLVRHLCDALSAEGVTLSGFYTEEVVGANGSRIGFDVVTVPDGQRGVLSRKQGLPSSYPKTGAYSVDVASFEALALPSIENAVIPTVHVIDEVGRMELHSAAFQAAVRRLLSDPSSRVIGAITAPIYGHRVAFCDEIAEADGVCVRKITQKTRGGVRDDMLLDARSLAARKHC